MKYGPLNPEQQKAVTTTEGPLLLLAGAGSGKTRVLTQRIAYLIELGLNPFNILAITFTNKAAREMRERVEALVPKSEGIWISTFHAACVRILRRYIHLLGFERNFTIYDTDDQERLMKEVLRELNVSDKQFTPKAVLNEIGRQKEELISPLEYDRNANNDFRLMILAKAYRLYQKRLKGCNALDFDDIIYKTVELFLTNREVLEEYQERFLYIMVDEYQDTNTAQYQFVKLLAMKYKNLCVVGDDDQSIYGWRGANIRNILDFEKDYTQCEVIKLEQNYRSSATILNAANGVIANNKGRKAKKLWTEKDKGSPVRFMKASTDLDEANFVVSTIMDRAKEGARYSDFAVLYRTNAQSRLFEDQLVRYNIPYKLVGGVGFYKRREVKDMLAYLRVIVNTNDEVSLTRIINVPRRGIGPTTLQRIADYAIANDISFFTALKDKEAQGRAKSLDNFVGLINELIEKAKDMTVSSLIEYVIKRTGYDVYLLSEPDDEGKERLANVQELVSKAVQFEAESENSDLATFLEEIALVADIDGLNAGDEGVTLMTIHAAKGLEFPCVFLAGLEEGIFPGFRSLNAPTPSELEEERRLCYVAITRAMERLYISCANTRTQYGRTVYNPPSRFLKEIPPECVEGAPVRGIKKFQPKEGQRTIANDNLRDSVKNVNLRNEAESYLGQSLPKPKNASLDFSVGDQVTHFKYGVGTVKNIQNAGADYEVTVLFESVGTKKFMAHLSRLEKI